jgi:hypothetical protein
MVNDNIKPTGTLDVVLKKADGTVKEKHRFKNIVVTTGKEFIARRMIDDAEPFMSEMAIGDSNANLEVGNTTLGNELARVTLDSSTATSNVVTYIAEFDAGVGTGGIVEAGIFNGESDDIMLCRTTFPIINKEADDILSINWNVTIN